MLRKFDAIRMVYRTGFKCKLVSLGLIYHALLFPRRPYSLAD